jgi:hypothetical protein
MNRSQRKSKGKSAILGMGGRSKAKAKVGGVLVIDGRESGAMFLAECRCSPERRVLGPRRRIAEASVVNIWGAEVEGIELSKISMFMSSI